MNYSQHVPLRVLLTCKYLPPESEGGGALTVHALTQALAREGVDVTVLKARWPSESREDRWPEFDVVETAYRDRFDYRARGMPDFYGHLAAKMFNHRSYRRALRGLLAERTFDVVHAQNHTTALAAASLRPRNGLPLAATLRGHGLWCFVLGKALPDGSPCSGCVTSNQIPCLSATSAISPPTVVPKLAAMKSWMRFQDRLTRRIDLLLPISTMMSDEARRYGRPTRIIPDLVADLAGTTQELPEPVRSELGRRRDGQRVALSAGRLAPNKGLGLVLDAAAERPGWLFLVAGDETRGTYAAELRQRAGERGLDNVRFLGWIPNAAMPALYDAVDVVLLPFLRPEPLSRGMVEALSRGRPLAATAHGGPLDAVTEGANGVLFEANTEGMIDALDRLAAADLTAMGNESRRVFETRFHPDRVVRDHLDAYEWLVRSLENRK